MPFLAIGSAVRNINLELLPEGDVKIVDFVEVCTTIFFDETFENAESFEQIESFTRNNNVGAQSRSRFESNIMDILNHQLNINVRKNPGRQVSIKNMMIRPPHTTNDVNLHQYTDYPSIVEVSQDPNAQLYRELYGDFDLRFR